MSSIAYVLVFVLCFWRNCWCFEQLEQFSLCSTGKRLENDQLLINDSLIAHDSLTKEPYINFMYDLKEPITYIEISANNNIYARVELNYDDTLIKGLITNIQPHNGNNNKLMPLEMIVQIFGFNVTVAESFNSNGVLKNNTTYMLVIAPIRDYLLYENYQTSTEKTDQLSTHSVIFYYIDKNYITQVKFIIIDHFIENKLNGSAYKPPIVEYSHLSPTTLKAIITDRQTTSLFVQMLLYGYRPKDLPVDYVTFLPNAEKLKIYNSNNIDGDDERGIATEGPMSSMKRLKLFMNAENERQQQEQREQEQQYGLRQTSNGLVPTNDSPAEGNMKVLCWKPAEDKAATTTSHSLLVLNLIVIAITGTFMQLLFG
ncbi:hypothetical protein GQX74_014784 [Glossina fuscipes]|nr:hypothetical protein GQX74_014784 [Glossina fuscipes]